jgi:hypothetical protein
MHAVLVDGGRILVHPLDRHDQREVIEDPAIEQLIRRNQPTCD